MKLAIFDFDGTLSKHDSFLEFILYTHGTIQAVLGLLILSPILALYALKILSNSKTKEIFLRYFYEGWDFERFSKTCTDFGEDRLPKILRKSAKERLDWHKKQNHKIVIVTASPKYYLSDWCKERGYDLIATYLQVKDNKITGFLEGNNCYGEEKVNRVTAAYDLKQFEYIYAYGDSKGDLPLAKIANEFQYKPFRNKFR